MGTTYIRDWQHNPVGCLVYAKTQKGVYYGYSVKHPKDKFVKKEGRRLAMERCIAAQQCRDPNSFVPVHAFLGGVVRSKAMDKFSNYVGAHELSNRHVSTLLIDRIVMQDRNISRRAFLPLTIEGFRL